MPLGADLPLNLLQRNTPVPQTHDQGMVRHRTNSKSSRQETASTSLLELSSVSLLQPPVLSCPSHQPHTPQRSCPSHRPGALPTWTVPFHDRQAMMLAEAPSAV